MGDLPLDINWQDETIRHLLLSLVLLLIAFILTRVGQRVIPRYIEAPSRRYRASKIISRTATLISILALVALWSPGAQGLLTVLTVIGAGLAIAMREVLLGFFGWVNIVLRSTFAQGDRISINGVRGDVIDIRLLHSTMMEIGGWVDADQSTGRIVHIPNGWVFQHAVYNYTHGFTFIWNEIPLTVTFRSNWQEAREIMLSLAEVSAEIVEQQAKEEIRRMSREYLIHYSILTPFVYVALVQNGVQLTLRYLCEARKRRGTQHALTMGILEAFKERDDIELAYPMVGLTRFDTPQFGPMPGDRPPADA